jgi:hypothetical protein
MGRFGEKHQNLLKEVETHFKNEERRASPIFPIQLEGDQHRTFRTEDASTASVQQDGIICSGSGALGSVPEREQPSYRTRPMCSYSRPPFQTPCLDLSRPDPSKASCSFPDCTSETRHPTSTYRFVWWCTDSCPLPLARCGLSLKLHPRPPSRILPPHPRTTDDLQSVRPT